MGAFSHLTRRKFLKSAAAGAGAVAANKMLPSDLTAGGHQKIMPPNGRFKDIELTYFQVYVEVENCCQALSERLENQRYFFNNK